MRWVFTTPLGRPVEPEVKSILATVSGPVAANVVGRPAATRREGRVLELGDTTLARGAARQGPPRVFDQVSDRFAFRELRAKPHDLDPRDALPDVRGEVALVPAQVVEALLAERAA